MSTPARDRGAASATTPSASGAPLGLLSSANADLFRRFEAEEAKTNQLRAKEKQQSATLAALSDRIEELNRQLAEEEEACAQRTEEIKQELETLDREESLLDSQIHARKRQVQAMSSALADIRVQLAYNFTVLPSSRSAAVAADFRDGQVGSGGAFTNDQRRASSVSSRRGSFRTPPAAGSRLGGYGGAADVGALSFSSMSANNASSVTPAAQPLFNPVEFAESLTESEMADIVGESVFVDEAGVAHRVVFTDERTGSAADVADDDTASSVNASPSRSQLSRLKSDRGRSSRASSNATASGVNAQSGSKSAAASHAHWAQNTTAKRASYVLLATAREEVAKQMRDAEDRYQRGECVVDAEHTATVAALQKKLDELTNAMRMLLLTTPTAASLQQSPSLAQSGAAGGSGAWPTSTSQKVSSRRSRRGSMATHGNAPVDGPVMDEEAVGSTIAQVLAITPNAAPGILSALAAQRQHVEDLKHALASEEAFVAARRSTRESAWVQESMLRDQRDFEQSRSAVADVAVPPASAVVGRVPQRPASAPTSAAVAQRAPSSEMPLQSPTHAPPVGLAPKLPEGSSSVVMRPACAPRLQRYASAASRMLNRGSRSTTNTPYERQYDSSAVDSALRGGKDSATSAVGSEYRFRSHTGICSAVERRGGPRRHEEDQDGRDPNDTYVSVANPSH